MILNLWCALRGKKDEKDGAADAQLISENTDGNRGSVAKILSASNRFVVVRKDGHKVLYGVKG